MASNEAVLLRDQHDGIATLTLNRPRQYNALSVELIAALQAAFDEIAGDESVRVVIIAGAGKAFCAGHDLKQMRAHPQQTYYEALFQQCSRMMHRIVTLPQPVIANVHGIATAAGCQLVAQCDLAIAADTARFATSGINVGLFCATPGVAVSRVMARKHALEMLLTGRFISANEAAAKGLINDVVPLERLAETVQQLAGEIAAKSAIAVRMGKASFYRQLELGLADAYAIAGEVMACNMMAEDAQEGIDAFIEKRPPVWAHR